MRVTKDQAIISNLVTAVRVLFVSGDPIAIYTLVGAASLASFDLTTDLGATLFCSYGRFHGGVGLVLDQFPVFRRNDESRYGEFLTKRLVLECYDRLSCRQCR